MAGEVDPAAPETDPLGLEQPTLDPGTKTGAR